MENFCQLKPCTPWANILFMVVMGLTVITIHICLKKQQKIVIGRVGAYCGCIHIAQPKSWITDNSLYISEKIVPYNDNFLAYYLKHINLNKVANSMAQPLVSGQLIYPIEIFIPPVAEQENIAAILKVQMADTEKIQPLNLQLDTINKLPAALLKRAFNGEL